MVDFVTSAPQTAVRRQRPPIDSINLPTAQRARPNPIPPPRIPMYGLDNQTPPPATPPFGRMINRSMALGLSPIAQKLIMLMHRIPAGADVNLMTTKEVATAAGLNDEDLAKLNESEVGISALPLTQDTAPIMSNGAKVKHNHGNDFSLRTIQRPLLIWTNSGITQMARILKNLILNINHANHA